MKKNTFFLFAFFFGIATNLFAQTDKPATDFYAGKWEIMVMGTPNGDAKFAADLVRKEGKLTGELKVVSTEKMDPIPATVEEAEGKITIFFSTQGYDVNIALSKVDDNNLKGTLMDMFEAKAVRVK